MAQDHVVIVDCNHMLHTFYNGNSAPLKWRVRGADGEFYDKDTTIQNGMIKNIYKWSGYGYLPIALCFDRPCPARKRFFQDQFSEMKVGSGSEYKGKRESMPDAMFTASQDVYGAFKSVGASVYSTDGYEADDLVMACIKRAKAKYPGYHIDVVTNDADLLPLVSKDVSVFLRSKRGTYAREKQFEKNHYIEITPENYQEEVQMMSDYKKFLIPYNSLLLHKLLRGDKSDQYGIKDISKKFPPLKYNALIESMVEGGVDFSEVFRYDEPVIKIMNRVTGEEFKGTKEEAISSPDKGNLYQKVINPKALDRIIALLEHYTLLSGEELGRIEKVYWGMNLNMIYPNSDRRFSRGSFVIPEGGGKGIPDIGTYSSTQLKSVVHTLFGINLK